MVTILTILIFVFAIIFTIKYRFIQIKSLVIAPLILFKEEKKSSYQTFMVALASHIGTGNIVGIATAIIYGGVGSLFWMWIFAIFSSIFALIENTLAQIYKKEISGEYRGGSSYYTKYGLNKKILPLIFAVFMILTNTVLFQPLQVNTISESINFIFGLEKIYIWIILFLFTIFLIFRGTHKIIKFSEFIVPIMSVGYFIISLIIIIINIDRLPQTLLLVIKDAFNFKSIFSGFASSCFLVGIRRSLFSHEAGLGTMPTISAMAKSNKPIEQGHIQVFGVFIDTIVLCTLTGIVIIISNIDVGLYEGCDLIINIYTLTFGKIGKIICMFFLLTFALATVVSEYYLGESNLIFIFRKNNKKIPLLIYRLLFICGTIIGTFFSTKSIFDIIDVGMVIIGILNIYVIFKLRKVFEMELFMS